MIGELLGLLPSLIPLDDFLSRKITARELVETSGKVFLEGRLAAGFQAVVDQAVDRDVQVHHA